MTYVWSHVLYGHNHRPARLDLACPGCGASVSFSKLSEEGWEHSGDCNARNSWSKDDWNGTCSNCIRRFEQLSYGDLPRPFYFDEGTGIWAWNLEHLAHLIKVFSGEPDKESAYSFYDTYLPKEWLKRKSKVLKVLVRLRAAHPG